MQKLSVALLCSAMASGVAVAQESGTKWKKEAELGYVATSGNTETQTLSAKAKAEAELTKWRHKAGIEMLQSEDDNSTIAEKYNVYGQTNYKFAETQYAWGTLGYEDDRFSGFKYQVTAAAGYGIRVINKEAMTLDFEAGPGVRIIELDAANSDSDSEGVFRIAGNFQWDVSETAHFSQELTSEIGEDITISKSVTALQSQVNGSLAMKLTYTLKNTSDVPVGIKETDTETAVTLVYSF